MRKFIAFLAVFAATAAMAQAYRWVDEEGVVHYSDRPREGAERIQLPTSTQRSRPTVVAAARTATQPADEPQDEGPFEYDVVEVSSPAPEETLWNIEGVLNVSINLQPGLQPGHQIRVYYNGEPRVVNSTSFQLEEVWRGVHNIQVEVLDETGTLMGRSVPNRFYVQQTTINRPPRPSPN